LSWLFPRSYRLVFPPSSLSLERGKQEGSEFYSGTNGCAGDCVPSFLSFFLLFSCFLSFLLFFLFHSFGRFIPIRDPRRLSNGSGAAARRDVKDRRKPRWVARNGERGRREREDGKRIDGRTDGRKERWTDGSTKKRVSGRLRRPRAAIGRTSFG